MQRADGRSHKQLAALCLFQPLSRLAATAPRSGSLLGGTMCQDIRVNTPVGTRSPYSLPFVILPVPARSPFRFIRHWRRSTPNPVRGAFWRYTQTLVQSRRAANDGPYSASYKLFGKNKGTHCVPSFLQSLMLIRRQADFAARISALTGLPCLQRRRVLWCRRP